VTAPRDTAEPITAAIAERVRNLRRDNSWTQEDLAAALVEVGVPWNRATVINLEARAMSSRSQSTPGRDSISVQELLGLARVLKVAPGELVPELYHDTTYVVAAKLNLLRPVERKHVADLINLLLKGQSVTTTAVTGDVAPLALEALRTALMWREQELSSSKAVLDELRQTYMSLTTGGGRS
jgi:transcriptional regulator with XRE-family HTH domain